MSTYPEVFQGYKRQDGSVGVRNYLGVLSTVSCANQVARELGSLVQNASVFTHQQGCCLTQDDLALTERTLINLGRNPNLGAVLLVSLGCEGVNADRIMEGIAASGKPVELVRIQGEGGFFVALKEGGLKAQELSIEISKQKREDVPIQALRLGIKCGASDPSSGISSNPAIGKAVDELIGAGGSVVFGEATEIVGAEHLLVTRCVNQEVADKLMACVEDLEMRVRQSGADIRGGNPTAGNIAAGLTTLEEKSLGAIAKAGSCEIQDVFEYGECPPRSGGLFFVDSPGREPEILAALAAAGSQVILFSTGIGAPHGFPFVPVIKISGNRKTVESLIDFIDVNVAQVILEGESLDSAGERISEKTLEVASGERTKAEAISYYGSTAIYQKGPII
jgi:altronate dehydratase large subunit